MGVSSCEFKSHSPHQKNRLIYSDGFFVFIAIIQPVAGSGTMPFRRVSECSQKTCKQSNFPRRYHNYGINAVLIIILPDHQKRSDGNGPASFCTNDAGQFTFLRSVLLYSCPDTVFVVRIQGQIIPLYFSIAFVITS